MYKKQTNPEDMKPTQLTVSLCAHIVRDLAEMEKNTKKPLNELVSTALKMFIATHNDYLGRNRFS